MARISGIDIPNNKRSEIGLTYMFGIGPFRAKEILKKAGIDPSQKIGDLTSDDISKLRKIIEKEYVTEGDLRTQISLNLKRLSDIGCYRGRRHRMGLPVRGQNTQTNARTRKGPRKTVAGKKKETK
ncbi:MAG: 30S ribosomal protein S13 [Fibrobacteria bacterium]|nr:30S ribosomal protein S13 [Fibrobacteria bacterium]